MTLRAFQKNTLLKRCRQHIISSHGNFCEVNWNSSPFVRGRCRIVYWNSKDLKGFEDKLKPKMNELKIGLEQLGAWGNHTAGVAHREADGEAEGS